MNSNQRSEAGFTLIEALVATTIMVVVTAGVFSVLNPSTGAFQRQPEMSDIQQRLRVGMDTLKHDLVNAGAGSYSGMNGGAFTGQNVGSLVNYFAPIQPFKQGWDPTLDDGVGQFFNDRITIIYVPSTAAQTTVNADMANASSRIVVNAETGCPQNGAGADPLCGFKASQTKAVIYDGTGAFDTFAVTAVDETTSTLDLQHTQQGTLSKAYLGSASAHSTRIAEISYHVYFLDPVKKQLMHYDGLTTATPVLDNVVGLNFEYYGDPQPPAFKRLGTDQSVTYGPMPPALASTQAPFAVGENCIWQMSGGVQVLRPPMASLGNANGGLVPLTAAQLTDGPWCPDANNANKYDADLLRIRKIRVTLRLQSGNAALRGSLTTGQNALFTNAGTAKTAAQSVPDQSIRFDVSPRNMNLGR
jgi:type II secretory pathway pseudopilin PulG